MSLQLPNAARSAPVTTAGENPANLEYSSKNQDISRAPVFMSGAGMSSCGPITSLIACSQPVQQLTIRACNKVTTATCNEDGCYGLQ